MCGSAVHVEGRLISPGLNHGEMTGPLDLFEQFEAQVPLVSPARTAVVLEGRDGRSSRRGLHLEIPDAVDGARTLFPFCLRREGYGEEHDGDDEPDVSHLDARSSRYITRARRMTASAFWRISRAASYGSPC